MDSDYYEAVATGIISWCLSEGIGDDELSILLSHLSLPMSEMDSNFNAADWVNYIRGMLGAAALSAGHTHNCDKHPQVTIYDGVVNG